MIEDGKTTETEITTDGAVEIQDEQLDTASGGAHDFYLKIEGVKGESKVLGGSSARLGDGSVRGIKYTPGGGL